MGAKNYGLGVPLSIQEDRFGGGEELGGRRSGSVLMNAAQLEAHDLADIGTRLKALVKNAGQKFEICNDGLSRML
jgi:hypothetical protein